MPYSVAYRDTGIRQNEFDAYVRLLEQRGIDWTRTPRIPEPGTDNRWLHVWEDRADAEEFRAAISQETRDSKWYVRELHAETPSSPGPLTPVTIVMVRRSLGMTFSLHPHSRALVRRRYPDAQQVSSISVEYGTRHEFEELHGPIWEHVAIMLTGLSIDQLDQLEGFEIIDASTWQSVYASFRDPAHHAA